MFDPSRAVRERAPRLWTLWAAARPSQVALVGLVYLLGAGMATTGWPIAVGGPPTRSSLAVGAATLLPTTVAIHYANEYADRETDRLTTRTRFSGGSGALVVTGLPASFLRVALLGAVVVAVGALAVAATHGLPADAAAVLGVMLLLGLAYSLPPLALVRRGVGESVNAVLGGLLLPLYGVAVVGTPGPVAVVVPLPFALVVGCNLLATHWPDRDADAATGKRTLAVRWAPPRLRQAYAVLALLAGVVTLALALVGVLPPLVVAAHLLPLPALLWGFRTLTRQRSPFPAVLAMVSLAVALTAAWWLAGAGVALPA